MVARCKTMKLNELIQASESEVNFDLSITIHSEETKGLELVRDYQNINRNDIINKLVPSPVSKILTILWFKPTKKNLLKVSCYCMVENNNDFIKICDSFNVCEK